MARFPMDDALRVLADDGLGRTDEIASAAAGDSGSPVTGPWTCSIEVMKGFVCRNVQGRFCIFNERYPWLGDKICGKIADIICNSVGGGRQDCKDVPAARDPNELIGPSGYGYEHWIGKVQELPYAVYFENDPELATAPAQVVSIRQPLDEDLDVSTLRLGSFGFGGQVFSVPGPTSHYVTRVDLVDTSGVLVDVTGGIDVNTNEVFWIFRSIDPVTGLPPGDSLAGFLPINDPETHVGEGFVSYTIVPRSDVATGDVIDAQAEITFDVNEPVETPAIFNTIDADDPITEVQPLTYCTDSPTFEVNWVGEDTAGGSGFTDYSIFFAKMMGPMSPGSQHHGDIRVFRWTAWTCLPLLQRRAR